MEVIWAGPWRWWDKRSGRGWATVLVWSDVFYGGHGGKRKRGGGLAGFRRFCAEVARVALCVEVAGRKRAVNG